MIVLPSHRRALPPKISEIHHLVFAAREEGALVPRAASNINHQEDA